MASRLCLIGEQCNLESSFGDNPPAYVVWALTPEAIPWETEYRSSLRSAYIPVYTGRIPEIWTQLILLTSEP